MLCVAALVANVAVDTDADAHRSRAKRAQPPDPPGSVAVTVSSARPGRPVPSRYLGISFEASVLPQVASFGDRGDFGTLLR